MSNKKNDIKFSSSELDSIQAGLYLLSQTPEWSGKVKTINEAYDKIENHINSEDQKIDNETEARLLSVQLEETF